MDTLAEKTGEKSNQIVQGILSVSSKDLYSPLPGNLAVDHTKGPKTFEVVGVNFAASLKYWKSKKQKGNAYRIAYSCGLTCTLPLEVLTSMETRTKV